MVRRIEFHMRFTQSMEPYVQGPSLQARKAGRLSSSDLVLCLTAARRITATRRDRRSQVTLVVRLNIDAAGCIGTQIKCRRVCRKNKYKTLLCCHTIHHSISTQPYLQQQQTPLKGYAKVRKRL